MLQLVHSSGILHCNTFGTLDIDESTMVCHEMDCSSIWIIHQSRRFACLLDSLLHLRRSLALSAGTKIDKLRTVLGTIRHEYYDNSCVHAHCMHCSIKRHIARILFLPLSGTGACKS
jgi:hypothetical protein